MDYIAETLKLARSQNNEEETPTSSGPKLNAMDVITKALSEAAANPKNVEEEEETAEEYPEPEDELDILPPPPDLQPVVDRLAMYVAKNGESFEKGIKAKQDPRFDFLNSWNMYSPYYRFKKKQNIATLEKQKIEGKF